MEFSYFLWKKQINYNQRRKQRQQFEQHNYSLELASGIYVKNQRKNMDYPQYVIALRTTKGNKNKIG
jgi:hypothetical protein